MELDSALNEWVDALPDFCNYATQPGVTEADNFYLVKYNPHQKESVFAHQSVLLYAGLYWARIQGLSGSEVLRSLLMYPYSP
jgi:hypothetical protein